VTPGPDHTGVPTLQIEVARAGVNSRRYAAGVERGLLRRFQPMQLAPASGFPPVRTVTPALAGSCKRAIQAAARDAPGARCHARRQPRLYGWSGGPRGLPAAQRQCPGLPAGRHLPAIRCLDTII
jgi:hypothetical protein